MPPPMRRRKRALDVGVASVALLATAPLILTAGLAVVLDDGGPMLFRQQRVGVGGRSFSILKIRSMCRDAEHRGPPFTVGDDPRITRVGRLLRATKVDELPQLVNVLRGDMTLVGPRPETLMHARQCQVECDAMALLTPGITDPAALAFRWEAELLATVADPGRFYWEVVMPGKRRISVQYARSSGLRSDLRVLWSTVKAVAKPSAPPMADVVRRQYAPDVPSEVARARREQGPVSGSG